jgi:ribonuclease HII
MIWVIGIDEVGRGPLAGPVTVCALAIPANLLNGWTAKFGDSTFDSKKLSPTRREAIVRELRQAAREGKVTYKIASVSPAIIDQKGIVFAVNLAVVRTLTRLGSLGAKSLILLDGGLHAPKEYKKQKTITRGDSSVSIIGLASVLAKVHRDRKMTLLATMYPSWGFDKHKGYGTRAHYAALAKHDPSPIHRLSFL